MVIDCQENRSFDHYFGHAPWVGKYGIPEGYSQPDGNGGTVVPYQLPSTSGPDVDHGWQGIHKEWDFGAMDGFYTVGGRDTLGYYTKADLPYYYSLFNTSTLCVNYFCSLLGPTYPNRFYLVSATSAGITTNGVYGYGVLDYPIILDLLEAAGVTWKVYNIGFDDVPTGYSDNVFAFFKRWANDPRTRASKKSYLRDLERGSLPEVSFIIPSYTRGWDEHPPADIQVGMRVPTWVISPHAKPRHLEPTVYEHVSILKFLETLFGLPTLASINHRFDERTPGGPNNEAASGYPFGPAAPPRDRLDDIGNLMECFDF